MIRNLLLLIGLTLCIQARGQVNPAAKDIALRFLQGNPVPFNLSTSDVADIRVSDVYPSRHNGITHVWLQQQHHGIPVFNALFGLHVKPDGAVLHVGHRFENNLAARINTLMPALGASRALEMAMLDLGFEGFPLPAVRQKVNSHNYVFEGGAISRMPIPVSLCYTPLKSGRVVLSWTLVIEQANTSDVWNMRVDAMTGAVLDKINQTVYCTAGHVHESGTTCDDRSEEVEEQPVMPINGTETYHVFALPAESPAHGSRVLLADPADIDASPFGWLDTNGAAGAEYTYTRGNNVWAFDDSANDNTPTVAESADGGPSLLFDFPFDPDAEPTANRNSAITNLFYMNNMMHDISYKFGFDEFSGNFQSNNYGNGGLGNDYVLAQALDGSGTDNANFSTPADGGNGRMQMYPWSRQGGKIVRVNAPGAVLGAYGASAASGWGAPITTTAVTGEVAIVNDGTSEGSLGCGTLAPLAGKIALIDRGVCEFGRKALNAQQAGAIGCVICNFEDGTIGMAAGSVGGQVTIPAVMMTKGDCDLLRQYAGAGLNISLVQPAITGPAFLDGDFDNGIIAHEYGHGISNRLTGGPSQAGCLANAEQMGEGWSDWFTLITGSKESNVGTQRRGVGTYVLRQDNNGQGIRRYPYTTDMSINPVTFSTVAENTAVHPLGEIWAAVTWDLYWAMVEKYGYDASLTNKDAGNYKAIQLVMDGLKFQPCSPGFVDGRDAIMLADIVNYNGADTCLISTVFARRGLGYFADQGDSDNAADGIENFDPIPTCVKELKISKATTTPLIDPGGFADYTITITNHKDTIATGVVITDEIPDGLDFVSASAGGTAAAGLVVWNIGTMASGAVVTVTYRAKATPGVGSLCYYKDPMDDIINWFSFSIETNGGEEFFQVQSQDKLIGNAAFKGAASTNAFTDFTLETTTPINVWGEKPVMRFWHKINTESGSDAGFIEVQRVDDPAQKWNRLPADRIFRNPYTGKVQYGTFAIPFLYGFSGNSQDWIQSYVDFSDYRWKDINVRFRFGTDDNNGPVDGSWIVDEVQFMDMVNFEGNATVMSSEGDKATAQLKAGGVIVNTDCTVVSADDVAGVTPGMRIMPNPAKEVISVVFNNRVEGKSHLSLLSAEGRLVRQKSLDGVQDGQMVPLDIQGVPPGVYSVRWESSTGLVTHRLVVQ
jgi:uncharacterized repeat protein (TIGR01451 family)